MKIDIKIRLCLQLFRDRPCDPLRKRPVPSCFPMAPLSAQFALHIPGLGTALQFHAVIVQGEPQRLEHQDIRWITREEISQYPFCPADDVILARLQAGERGAQK